MTRLLSQSPGGNPLAGVRKILDLKQNALPVDTLKKELVKRGEPVFEAVAFQGVGVFETLKDVARQVLIELKKG